MRMIVLPCFLFCIISLEQVLKEKKSATLNNHDNFHFLSDILIIYGREYIKSRQCVTCKNVVDTHYLMLHYINLVISLYCLSLTLGRGFVLKIL